MQCIDGRCMHAASTCEVGVVYDGITSHLRREYSCVTKLNFFVLLYILRKIEGFDDVTIHFVFARVRVKYQQKWRQQ